MVLSEIKVPSIAYPILSAALTVLFLCHLCRFLPTIVRQEKISSRIRTFIKTLPTKFSYDMPLYEVADPEDPTEKHIAVGFNYSLLDDFLNTWKKKRT